ncbi:MAG: TIGR02449 family protein [Gammaproteobacteria bacterium]
MSDSLTESASPRASNPGAAQGQAPRGTGSISSLEARIDELIRVCDDLCAANTGLREQQAHLMAERASLIEKSELARSRVEAMIARLKAMEINV